MHTFIGRADLHLPLGAMLTMHAPCLRLSHAAHHSREVNGVYKRPTNVRYAHDKHYLNVARGLTVCLIDHAQMLGTQEKDFKRQIAIMKRCTVRPLDAKKLWDQFME